jgi:uncharacterized damage-inducible protein DinB
MSMIQMFLKELDQEAITTRKMLSRIPDDRFDWKPHEKSMDIRSLATHIADLPSWVTMALTTEGLDFAENPYESPQINSNVELMEFFETSLEKGRASLTPDKEAKLNEIWTLRNGEQVYSRDTKAEVIRMAYNQIVHHRAQMGVYLRLLNIPIPGSYGPSADEMSF